MSLSLSHPLWLQVDSLRRLETMVFVVLMVHISSVSTNSYIVVKM